MSRTYQRTLPSDAILERNRALLERATAACREDRFDDALATTREMLSGWSEDPFARNVQAVVHVRMHRVAEAIELLEVLVADVPGFADAWSNLGEAHRLRGDLAPAETALRRALALEPDGIAAAGNLVDVLCRKGALEEASRLLGPALARAPEDGVLLQLEGKLRMRMGDPAGADRASRAALGIFRRELDLHPQSMEVQYRLAAALMGRGSWEEAEELFASLLVRQPGNHSLRYDWGLLRLAAGDPALGWPAYESRLSKPNPVTTRSYPGVHWTGDRLPGVLFVPCEQGMGDAIQFARFLPRARARAGALVAEAPPPILDLFRRSFPGIAFVPRGAPPPAFDRWCSLLSLPAALGIDSEEEHRSDPYLRPRPGPPARPGAVGLAAPSSSRSPAVAGGGAAAAPVEAPGLRVGVVWAGNPDHPLDHCRSLAPELLAPLRGLPGVRLVSLQVGRPVPAGFEAPGEPGTGTVDDTATLLGTLDLLITVDTMPAHLASALGLPVWMLIPDPPDWRWGRAGHRTVWYDRMRIFRQERPGYWEPVLRRVAAELAARAAESPGERDFIRDREISLPGDRSRGGRRGAA